MLSAYAIPSVSALNEWVPVYPNLHESIAPLAHREKGREYKILYQYADYDPQGNGCIQDNYNTYYYNFNYWQYIDVFAFVGQGLFTIPTPGYINAAHRNGVKIIGALMSPVNQGEYTEEFKMLFTPIGDKFPLADKMVSVMNYFGFDGWFFNIEELLPEGIDWADVQRFMIYLNKASKKINPASEIHWYDSNYVFGSASYEERLDAYNVRMFQDDVMVSDAFFIDYSWSQESINDSKKMAISVDRGVHDIYAGVYCAGIQNNDAIRAIISKAIEYGVSVGMWGMEYLMENSSQPLDFYDGIDTLFRSLSSVIRPHPLPSNLPWSTDFNDGWGYALYDKGDKLSNAPWGDMSAQSHQLTNICDIDGIKLFYDRKNVYDGGRSLGVMITTTINKPIIIDLFDTSFNIDEPSNLSMIYNSSGYCAFDLIVTTADGNNMSYACTDEIIDADWSSKTYTVSSNIYKISLMISSGGMSSVINIGRISLGDNVTPKITNLRLCDRETLTDLFKCTYVNETLVWDADCGRYYDIYWKRPDFDDYRWLVRSYKMTYRLNKLMGKGDGTGSISYRVS